MARPNKEGMDYFPHDTDACSDEKIEVLRTLYGNDGYAFYFIMLERIYRTNNFQIDVSEAETREETFQILSKKVSVSQEKFIQMLNTALKWGCFDKELYENDGIITSYGIKKRAATVVNKRKAMKDKYEKSKIVSEAETREETMSETPQSKVKESKEKKRKEYKKDIKADSKVKYAEAVNMTEEEHNKLVSTHGQGLATKMIDTLNNYKLANGKTYKDDYRAILNWVVKRVLEENVKVNYGKGGGKPNGQHKENTGSGIDDDIIARLSI